MTPKEKEKFKAEQFELKLKKMQETLNQIGVAEEDGKSIMVYYRWLCFDGVLKEGLKPTARLSEMERCHLACFEGAVEQGLARIKSQKKNDLIAQAFTILKSPYTRE